MKKWGVFCAAMFFPLILWAADIPATLQWSQRVELSTPVAGIVQMVNVQVGDKVNKGQLLLSLDSTAVRAKVAENQSEISRLSAVAEEDDRDLARVLELHERTVVSTTELDQAKLKRVRSQALLSEARARLRQNQKALEDTALRAPFDAVVVLRQAEPGLSVSAGLQPQMLLTLAKSGEMLARMKLSSSQINNLKNGQALTVQVGAASYAGKIKSLGLEPVNNAEEPAYQVDVVFPCKEIFRAGTPARVALP